VAQLTGQGLPGAPPASAEDIEAARNMQLGDFFRNAKDNAELYVKAGVLPLQSPHALDYSKIGGMPLNVVETFQKMRVDTRNFDLFVEDVLERSAQASIDTGVSPETLAYGAAAIMQFHNSMLINHTGIATDGLRTSKLGVHAGKNGDSTNPGIIYTQLLQKIARKRTAALPHLFGANLGL
jgi:hypothetical protein